MTYVEYHNAVVKALEYALEQVESSGGEVEVIEGVDPSEQAPMLEEALTMFRSLT